MEQHTTEPTALYSTDTVCKMLDVSRQFIYEAVAKGDFPKPIKIGRLNRYKAEEIHAYIQVKANQ
ncbi:TPA: helix-turn-helix domain-containing protein [Pasteurella multocida]|nr:helix-turn-helix domain-containing protein [Pasteurella multocida]SUB46208.1 Predicted transcriptional regulator [Pasteurella multocida subsp. septica]HDR0635501.1 helix-turn-helix domain-containing protein [Pasteurella multocida]HDR1286078.1 helix-turn-helix domain-containing protein [Pasteurella multocida]HDR1290161.1 helix-turn-helix domain-containing protein [Pasteurella multocida]